jgi:cytidine deaminase
MLTRSGSSRFIGLVTPEPDSVVSPHLFQQLITSATEARMAAHAPYSGFPVGAAVQARDGRIFAGCNVENLSYGLTICAERNAIFQAVASGAREFRAIAIVADTPEPVSPCGACRQVMLEFGDFPVICATLDGKVFESMVSALLPRGRTGILGQP